MEVASTKAIIVALLAGLLSSIAQPALASDGPEPSDRATVFPISAVISEVKAEIAAAQNTPSANLGLSLQKVELNFALTQALDENGKITIGVPVIGGEIGGSGDHKGEQTSSLMIDLLPPSGSPTMSGLETKGLGLTQAIVATKAQLLKGLDQSPKLEPDKVVIMLKFAITNSGGPTGRIKFLVFTLGGGVTATSSNSSSIELTFSRAKTLS